MSNYKKSTAATLITSLISGLVCSYPYWFPSLCYSMRYFLFTSFPNIWNFFTNAKFLFIVGNFIVIFLVGESKLACSNTPVAEVYDEYVERSRISKEVSNHVGEKKENGVVKKVKVEVEVEEGVNWIKEDTNKKVIKEEKETVEEENSDKDGSVDKEIDGEEENGGLPAEELNKRVEEFVAKVNKQRCLEAKLFV